MEKLVTKDISSKILMIGEYFKNNAPGGMAAVLASYDMYFEDMKFIPAWKYGNLTVKIWYTIYSYILFLLYMLFDIIRPLRIVNFTVVVDKIFTRDSVFGNKYRQTVTPVGKHRSPIHTFGNNFPTERASRHSLFIDFGGIIRTIHVKSVKIKRLTDIFQIGFA